MHRSPALRANQAAPGLCRGPLGWTRARLGDVPAENRLRPYGLRVEGLEKR